MRPCRPACRSGRLDHALPRSSIRTARQVPRFVLPSGRRPAGLLALVVGFGCPAALVPWCLGAALLPVFAVVVVPPCAACRASKTVMAVGHPFMGRGSRRRWGNPEGVPRSQTALRRFVFRRWPSYPRFWGFQLQVIFIGKELQEHLTGLGGGRSIAKRGGRSNAETPIRGGRSIALGGGDLSWINWRIHRAYPQSGPVWDAFRCAFRW